ncbi:MAG: superinfection immunity protein [Dehalococcoidia bacterium]
MDAIFALALAIFFLGLYALPVFIAILGKKRNALGIVLVDLLPGWTLIGWLLALFWAIRADRRASV